MKRLASYSFFYDSCTSCAHFVFRYDDLKPPTSPSPTVPTASPLPTLEVDGYSNMANLSINNIAQSPTEDKPREQHHTGPNPSPLSPFTM